MKWATCLTFLSILAAAAFGHPIQGNVERHRKGNHGGESGNLPCKANAEGYGVGTDGYRPEMTSLMILGEPCHA